MEALLVNNSMSSRTRAVLRQSSGSPQAFANKNV
jgi:hypothetical protein